MKGIILARRSRSTLDRFAAYYISYWSRTMSHTGLPLANSGKARLAVWIGVIGLLVSFTCLAIPIYVIRPFRPQDPWQLDAALTIRGLAPWISVV